MKDLAERTAQAVHDYLTIEEVAEHYRRPESTIRWWRHNGYGPRAVKAGGRVIYPRAAVEAFDRLLAAEADAAASA
jgi:Helix-turn-helix domain